MVKSPFSVDVQAWETRPENGMPLMHLPLYQRWVRVSPFQKSNGVTRIVTSRCLLFRGLGFVNGSWLKVACEQSCYRATSHAKILRGKCFGGLPVFPGIPHPADARSRPRSLGMHSGAAAETGPSYRPAPPRSCSQRSPELDFRRTKEGGWRTGGSEIF